LQRRAGDQAALAWNPPLEYYRVDNRIRTGVAALVLAALEVLAVP